MSKVFTSQETATVLAALRYWQENVEKPKEHMPEYFEDCEPLTDGEINGLCESINCDMTFGPEDCDCAERSWYGPEHDSMCPLEGKREPVEEPE